MKKIRRGKRQIATKATKPTSIQSANKSSEDVGQATAFFKSTNASSLSHDSNHFFKARFGYDFSDVKIHTGTEAEVSANDLDAKAYTVGNSIVFNRNEYNPHSFEGKKLLAHELAHVMQSKQGTVADGYIQPQRSTPVPATAVVDPRTDIATFTVNSVNLVVEPDQTLRRGTTVTFHGRRIRVNRTGAVTAASLRPRVIPTYTGRGRSRRVTSVTLSYTLYIKTFYGTRASSSDTSAYGRGTTAADIAAGNTTLGFHEGSHGQDYQDYIAQNPLPQFTLEVPATIRQYNAAMRTFNSDVSTYYADMSSHSETHTDMVGTPMTP
ncbi:DUF4157 domain-containing protein [Lacibacter sp. H375]|uniref:eCIS core domain-containing protein n=1 Tax=Lacibacter sp. H375 TaxID=3133424 RepID=UPI0030C39337